MSAPNVKDLATSLVATAPSPAASGTSLVVTTNQGSRFPSTPFDAIVHPADQLPTVANAERVLVTARSGDTLTIDRAEGITTAQDIEVGWRISAAIFSEHVTAAYARANHTGTQAASTISDFDTEVSNNTDVAANTAARHTHANQSVLDNTTASFTTADETKLDGIEALADVTDAGNVGAAIHGATGKTTPVDGDTLPLIDSEASNVLKKVTWANIKATVKTYFDTLYAAISHTHAQSDITNLTTDLAAKVAGAASSTDNEIPRFDGTTGKLVQGSGITVADNGYVQLVGSLDTPGALVADTISEHTPAAGVTVDGVLLKDGEVTVSDEAYDATNWNGSLEVPTKNAVRDKIESMSSGGLGNVVEDLTPQLGGTLDMNGQNIQAGAATITPTELGYVDGVTSAIQTQLNAKKTDSMATNKLLGRGTAGTGAIEEITLGTNLSLSGSTLNASGGGSVTVEDENLIIGMRFFGF